MTLVIILNLVAIIFLLYETVGSNWSHENLSTNDVKEDDDSRNSLKMAYVGITFSLIFLGLVIESFIVISSNNQV